MKDNKEPQDIQRTNLYRVQGSWRNDILKRLRVCVTNQCNFNCFFCHNEGQGFSHQDSNQMSVREIRSLVEAGVRAGIEYVKITGGEPLTYRHGKDDIVDLVSNVSSIRSKKTVFSLSLVTNGYYLEDRARQLKSAGLDRVTVSIYSLKPDILAMVTNSRLPDASDRVRRGIHEAVKVGLTPVKVNMLLFHSSNGGPSNIEEIRQVMQLCRDEDVNELRLHTLIWHPDFPAFDKFYAYWNSEPLSNLSWPNSKGKDNYRNRALRDLREFASQWADMLYPQAKFVFSAESPFISVDPMEYGRFRETDLCGGCPYSEKCQEGPYALRVSATGKLKGCLLAEQEIDILTPLREGATTAELVEFFKQAHQLLPHEKGGEQG